ncbi:MAG: hypothetical protein U0797_27220 [Gemmataceae bacterium]
MNEVTRRDALHLAALGAAAAADEVPRKKTDRDFVLEAGLTPAEADCWALAAKLAGGFFDLPKMHPMDAQEVAMAIHVIQNKLLSRPTYRKYLENAKAAAKK